MEYFNPENIMALQCAAFPIAIMLIEDEGDRDFVSEIYLKYKGLMYKTALRYFSHSPQDMEDVISASVLNLCQYCKTVRSVPQERLPMYIVAIVRNACNQRCKEIYARRAMQAEDCTQEDMENLADESALHDVVFSRTNTVEVLQTFQKLSPRDREIIKLRHIDMLSVEEIASILGITVVAARAGISRARRRLEKLAKEYRQHMEGC